MIKEQIWAVETGAKGSSHHVERTLTRLIGDALREHTWVPPHVNDRAQTQSRLVKMIEATPDFIATIDAKGHVLYCNRGARKMLGIGGDEDTGKLHIADIYSAHTRATVLGEGVFIAILDGVWSGEAALLTRAGREIPVSQVIVAPAETDRRCEFLALIARDVQGMKQVEESLRESERFYRGIAEAANIGIWIIDNENQTSFVNPKMAKMLDYSVAEMLGKPTTTFMGNQVIALSQVQGNVSRSMLEQAPELILRRKDGAELWVSVSASPLFNEREQFTGTLAMVTEIAESRQRGDQARLWSGLR